LSGEQRHAFWGLGETASRNIPRRQTSRRADSSVNRKEKEKGESAP